MHGRDDFLISPPLAHYRVGIRHCCWANGNEKLAHHHRTGKPRSIVNSTKKIRVLAYMLLGTVCFSLLVWFLNDKLNTWMLKNYVLIWNSNWNVRQNRVGRKLKINKDHLRIRSIVWYIHRTFKRVLRKQKEPPETNCVDSGKLILWSSSIFQSPKFVRATVSSSLVAAGPIYAAAYCDWFLWPEYSADNVPKPQSAQTVKFGDGVLSVCRRNVGCVCPPFFRLCSNHRTLVAWVESMKFYSNQLKSLTAFQSLEPRNERASFWGIKMYFSLILTGEMRLSHLTIVK